MPPPWTLAQIERATKIPGKYLRYVLDAKILPGTRQDKEILWSNGRGAPRTFTDFEAFGLVLAARLLAFGVRRSTVMSCLDTLCAYPARVADVSQTAIYRAFSDRNVQCLEIAEPGMVRLISESSRPKAARDREWIGESQKGSSSPVRIRVDIADLRKALTNGQKAAKVK